MQVNRIKFDTSSGSNIRLNQVGYLPYAEKVATVITSSITPLKYEIRNMGGTAVQRGNTYVFGQDTLAGEHVHKVFFNWVTTVGTYKVWVDGIGENVPFDITANLYPNLPKEAMEYFYFHRMGEDLTSLSGTPYYRDALHPGDDAVACFADWCEGELLDVKNSWADAGDFGIYPVNHAVSAWTLLNLYERYPNQFPDGSLNIPEASNGIPDILDEVMFGSEYMEGMLPADTK
jgi:endoglucanase